MVYEAMEIQLWQTADDNQELLANGLWVLECLPNMLILALVCMFAYFWQEVYESFADSIEDSLRSIEALK